MSALTETSSLAGASQASGYNIDYSLRFNTGDSAKLSRTPSSAGNRRTWTISLWTKRSGPPADHAFMGVRDGSDDFLTRFGGGGLNLALYNGGSSPANNVLESDAVYRDQASWYHIVFAVDTTQAVNTNRAKMYVNGIQVTDLNPSELNYPTQNTEWQINNTTAHYIGADGSGSSMYYNGYLAEYYLIDGTQLTAADFGETDEDTGQWKAIKYAGSYGTNGFFLEFKDSAALGTDTSGNGNNWTVSNLAAADQMIDTPQNSNGGNFCTMNPLDTNKVNASNTAPTFSEGNLKVVTAGNNSSQCCGTMAMQSGGKWGFKYTHTDGNTSPQGEMIGIVKAEGYDQKTYLHNQNMAWFYYAANGNAYHNASGSSFGTALGVGDYLEFLLDTVGGTLKVKRNGTLIGTNMFSSLDDTDYLVAFDGDSTSGMGGEFDFGQSGYEPSDSNYTTICTNNLLEPSITLPGEHFNTVLYTGNGVGSRAITGVGFQPDYVWLKQTNNPTAYGHQNFDVIRGATNYLVPNTTAQENDGTPSYGDQTLLSFDSDGFSIGTSDTINESGYQVASWNWKASGSTTSNTEGTITSTVSANTTAGFSICKYTGNGTGNATFGHGLSTSPDLVVIKSITTVHGWMVWSPTFGSSGGDCTYLMSWDGTGGLGNWCEDTIRLNGTTKVQIGSSSGGTTYSWVNKTGTDYIAYCWNNIEGYSKRGIYYGNGISDGPFIYTGFRPAYLWVKGQAGSQHWHVFDTKRYPYNQTTNTTTTGTVIDEAANAGGGGGEGMGPIDILSNGFKLRANNGNGNDTSTTFTYLAFAESPFKYARAR